MKHAMVDAPMEVRGRRHGAAADRAAEASATPQVTVMLPVRNEAVHIEACLDRLLQQDYPSERLEILVIDGRSEDGTPDVVRQVQRRYPSADLKLLDNPMKTVPPALNLGIRAARGSVIVRMDGHAVPAPDYVSKCVAALDASGAGNVGGAVLPVGATPFGRAVAIATQHRLGAGDARYRVGGEAGDVDTVMYGAFRRDVFVKTGLFDESMVRNQDYEMNVRIRAAGQRVYLDPAIRFTYTPRGTVRGLAKQYFEYGWWRVETLRRHPGSLRWRQLVPALFVAGLIGAAALAPWWPFARFALLAVVALYVAVVAFVAVRTAGGRARVESVALAFAVIHLTWGAGFLASVLSRGTFPFRARPAHVPAWDGTYPDESVGREMTT
jgi:succinoglycan biosynthesis protein ExoA